MENKETSETLEEGIPDYLNNLKEKCVADVYSLEGHINHVELASKHGDMRIEESRLFDDVAGNNQINRGSLNNYPDDNLSILTCSDDIINNDVAVLGGDLNFNGNNEIRIGKVNNDAVNKFDVTMHSHELGHVEKVDEPIEKGNHMLHPHEPGSPTKIEVSGNNINLFVEVFGPLDEVSENSDGLDGNEEYKMGEREFDQEYPLEESQTIFKEESGKNEGIVECTFTSGDLVWVKTRSQSWWPGMILGPPKCEERVTFLVKYIGNPSFVWCDPSDLKPFVEFFEQISGQNNSRNFCSSVERVLFEIGQRVKLKMTCPCFAKESMRNNEENSVLAEMNGDFDVLSLSQFEPATFIACIKDLSCSVQAQSKFELTVTKNRLSSFYCSVGHQELPLDLLKSEVNDGENSVEVNDVDVTRTRRKKRNHGADGDGIASSGKAWDSRERKKSKYLSYPYVDANQEKEDPKDPSSLNTKSTPQSSSSGTKSRKGGTKKPLKGRHIVSKADHIDACSSELLAELRSAARDCFYLRESKYSDSLKRFYSSFRVSSFLDVDITCKDAGEEKEGVKVVKKSKQQKGNLSSANESVENVAGSKSPNTDNQPPKEKPKKRAKKKKEEATNSQKEMEGIGVVKESEENAVGDKFTITDNPPVKDNVMCSKSKQKKERVAISATQNSLSIGTTIFPSTSGMISFGQTCTNVPTSGTISSGLADINSITRLPDLNGNGPTFSAEHLHVGRPPTNLAKPLVSPNVDGVNHLIFTPVSSPKNVPVTLQNILYGTNQCRSEDFASRESGTDVMNSGLGAFSQFAVKMGIFGSDGKPKPRKRKRKEKTVQPSPAIPDLNGNMLDTSPSGNNMPDGSHISPEGEPPKKRANKSDSRPNGEPLGGNLLLTFTPESTVPPKENLIATFSRFGLLKESELQVLTDSTVQIAYERSADARFAFRSLEKSHPFGESLVSFKTDCTPPPLKIKKKKDVKALRTFVPVDAIKIRAKGTTKEAPDIAVIKQNVEMMKLTLEKAGDNLSPEIRAKLENEIKAFLDKISSIPGSSSS